MRKNSTQSGAVPVLGVNLLIAEIDIILLLTMELSIAQTGKCLYFVHKHHLRTTAPES